MPTDGFISTNNIRLTFNNYTPGDAFDNIPINLNNDIELPVNGLHKLRFMRGVFDANDLNKATNTLSVEFLEFEFKRNCFCEEEDNKHVNQTVAELDVIAGGVNTSSEYNVSNTIERELRDGTNYTRFYVTIRDDNDDPVVFKTTRPKLWFKIESTFEVLDQSEAPTNFHDSLFDGGNLSTNIRRKLYK